MSTRALIGMFVAVTAGVVIFLFVSMSSDPDGGSSVKVGTRTAAAACIGDRACLPKLTWVDTNGVAYTPESLTGKVVVVNFWATWCGPCKKEIPDFSKVSERYQGRAVVLGVLTDNPDENYLLNYMSDYDMSYPVVRTLGDRAVNGKDILLAFDYPTQLPSTFVYDTAGNQIQFPDGRGGTRDFHLGPMSEGKLSGVIDQALAAAR